MKKRSFLLCMLIICLLTTSAYAATPRNIGIAPMITYSGTTANCSVFIMGDSANDEIIAEVTLKNGNRIVETWDVEANGFLDFLETATVVKGQTYTLTVDATVNGKTQPTASYSRTCK